MLFFLVVLDMMNLQCFIYMWVWIYIEFCLSYRILLYVTVTCIVIHRGVFTQTTCCFACTECLELEAFTVWCTFTEAHFLMNLQGYVDTEMPWIKNLYRVYSRAWSSQYNYWRWSVFWGVVAFEKNVCVTHKQSCLNVCTYSIYPLDRLTKRGFHKSCWCSS